MKQIILESLALSYFKGAEKLDIKFDPEWTNIRADNRKGKTTIFDAFTWLLFGKDSMGSAIFDIKTLDAKNNAIPNVDHEVKGIFYINGVKHELRKAYREDWTKKRGAETAELTGHHNDCWWNGVPVSVGDYQKFVATIIPERIFKLVTNPLYFNSLDKKEKREILISLAGEINETEVAAGNPLLQSVLAKLEGRTREQYRLMVAAKRREMTVEMTNVNTRISEHRDTMPVAQDWAAIETQIKSLEKERDGIQDQLGSSTGIDDDKRKQIDDKWNQITKLREKKRELQDQANAAERNAVELHNAGTNELKNQLNALINGDLANHKRTFETLSNYNNQLRGELVKASTEKDAKIAQWNASNARTFEAKDCITCPIYGTKCADAEATARFQEDEDGARSAFNTQKAAGLERLNIEGKNLVAVIKKLTDDIENNALKLAAAETALNEASAEAVRLEGLIASANVSTYQPVAPETMPAWMQADKDITALTAEIDQLGKTEENTQANEMRERSNILTGEIKALAARLQVKDQIEAKTKRITELERQRDEIAQALSTIEGDEYALQEFTRAVNDELDRRINGRFRFVQFRLSKPNIGDGEEVVCDTLVNGVPYSSGLNNEARINAGIDIINTLCQHFEVEAPLWIDNREAVNELEATASQVINLIVSTDKMLNIDYIKF